MLEDEDISYIAARYSLIEPESEPEPLLDPQSAGEGERSERPGEGGGKERFGFGEEVIGVIECSDPASGSGCGRIWQNTLQPSLPNTLQPLAATGGARAELPFGTGASGQNTLIGPNTNQRTDRDSSTHTGTGINHDAHIYVLHLKSKGPAGSSLDF